jgi:hypothetical protein
MRPELLRIRKILVNLILNRKDVGIDWENIWDYLFPNKTGQLP